ncbi:sensor histidine kinase [Skermania sp. ID1734]|uniref:sensor histidine kinase n=1 Tax=Skermania sp. ID1734 TaxID=2597516 RepID=UPI00163D831E|nr:ATP-binding protein [Skermania sp. ID1734]
MATLTVPPQPAPEIEAPGSAEQRITRLFALFVASGYGFYLVVLAPQIVGQIRYVGWFASAVSVALAFLPPVALGTIGFRRKLERLGIAVSTCVFGYVAALAVWSLCWNGVGVADNSVWLTEIPGLAGLAAAIAWRPRWAVIALVGTTAFSVLVNHAERTAEHNADPVVDMLFSTSYSLLFVSAALMAVRTGRLLDETRAAAHSVAASAASAQARSVQRQRFNALLHDWVMSTLLAASRQGNTAEVRRQAVDTLRKFHEDSDSETYDAADLFAHLRVATNAIDDVTPVEILSEPITQATFPGEAVRTVGAAMSEALRNSIRHAGPGADRHISIAVTEISFTVVVADSGIGFDPRRIPPDRLGVAASIIGRMRALPGGDAEVRSQPGDGTKVVLAWTAP